MEDTAEIHKQALEKIRQETESAIGQPVEDVGNPEESTPVFSGLQESAKDLGDVVVAEVEEVGRGIFGGGTTETTKDTKSWTEILLRKFRKQAEDRGAA